jgi:hypothetical protein
MGNNGSIRDFCAACENNAMLLMLGAREYHNLIIEEIRGYGMPVGKEVFDTVRWTGRFQQIAENRFLAVHFVGRLDVKLHWCKSARAKDANVRQALLDHYGKVATKGISKDAWSALAIAGYWNATHPVRLDKVTAHCDENPDSYPKG